MPVNLDQVEAFVRVHADGDQAVERDQSTVTVRGKADRWSLIIGGLARPGHVLVAFMGRPNPEVVGLVAGLFADVLIPAARHAGDREVGPAPAPPLAVD